MLSFRLKNEVVKMWQTQPLRCSLKSPKTNTAAKELIEITSTMLHESASKTVLREEGSDF